MLNLFNQYLHAPRETMRDFDTSNDSFKKQNSGKNGLSQRPGPGRFLFLEHMGDVPLNQLSGAKSHYQQYGQSTIEQWFRKKGKQEHQVNRDKT